MPAHAAGVSGAWTITITRAGDTFNGKGELKASTGKITGWVGPSETDPIPVDGTIKGNKVVLKTRPQDGRTVAFAECDRTLTGYRMGGTIDTDKGTIAFVRAPSKSRSRWCCRILHHRVAAARDRDRAV
jgi:hypothetical protein